MSHAYHPPLIALSVLIAVLASYTALDAAGRVTAAVGRWRLAWLVGGSSAMGVGIWSMHFVAMLALRLPVPMAYDVPLVLLSVLVAVAASLLALSVVSRREAGLRSLLAAAPLMGSAIAGMHYLGMAAVRTPDVAGYRPLLVALSVAVAVGASFVALWLALRLREDRARHVWRRKVAGAVVMGLAVAGMHYTGMAAARFRPAVLPRIPAREHLLGTPGLAAGVVVATLIILGMARLALVIDRRAEAAVRQSDAELRAIFEGAPVGIGLTDADGRVVKANAAMQALLGYSADEFRRMTLADLTHPDDVPGSLAPFRALVAGGRESYQIEKRYRRRDGAVLWGRLTVSTLRSAAGEFGYAVGMIEDITERRRADEALRASEERYRLLFEANPCPMWVYDSETLGFLAVNEAAVRHYGYTREEFLAMTIRDIRPSGDVEPLERTVTALGVSASPSGAWRHRKKDGTLIDVDIASHPLAPEFAGRPARLVVVTDVTERTRLEAALRESEANHRLLVGSVRDYAIVRLDPAGRVASWNAGAARIKGYTEGEIVGQHFSAFYLPEDVAAGRPERALAEACAEGRVEDEGWRVRKDGSRFEAHVVITALRNPRGELVGFGKVTRDVTERKRLEDQLRQAQRLEAVGQLAGGVAHDFNNILTAITSNGALLLDDLDAEDPRREDVHEIQRAADRGAALTRQLLAFSRRQMLQPRVLDLNATVTDVEKMLQRLIREDITLVTALDPALGRVSADPGQLEQVLVNLAVNARDAMPEGGTLTVETANVELDGAYGGRHAPTGVRRGRYVRLAVSDTGCGMHPEVQARIFEPFFTTKGPGHGTGLGLATVYGIVKQSGGYVWCYSEPGHGTTFKVYLPQVNAPAEPRRDVGDIAPARGGTETVLLVEDDAALRAAVARVLAREGYTVLEAANGAEALRVLDEAAGAVDLVVSDLVMPEMSGPELSRRLGAGSQSPRARLLFMSGYTADAALRPSFLEPGTAFIEKPFAPDALARKIREVLDAAVPGGAPAQAR